MQKYQNNVINSLGQPVSGASVLVSNWPAGTTATIYSDNSGTPLANPMTADNLGFFSFYAADGHYQITITATGILPIVLNDVLLVDVLPADLSTSLPSSTGKLWNDGGVISTT